MLSPSVEADVLVDGREAHGHGAGAVHRRLVDQRNLQAVLLGPIGRFDRRAAGGHAAAEDQQIGFDNYSFKIRHSLPPLQREDPAGPRTPGSVNERGTVEVGL